MIMKKNIFKFFITICFVINSVVLFASNAVDDISSEQGDGNDNPPDEPINGFIIPMICVGILFVGYTFYKKNLIENQKA
jgi:hypothetical protein